MCGHKWKSCLQQSALWQTKSANVMRSLTNQCLQTLLSGVGAKLRKGQWSLARFSLAMPTRALHEIQGILAFYEEVRASLCVRHFCPVSHQLEAFTTYVYTISRETDISRADHFRVSVTRESSGSRRVFIAGIVGLFRRQLDEAALAAGRQAGRQAIMGCWKDGDKTQKRTTHAGKKFILL